MKITKNLSDKFIKLSLRMIPFFPAPELYDMFRELKISNKEIDIKIDNAYNSLKNTAQLIEELHKELAERTVKVHDLKEKYTHYNKLAEIEQEKAKIFLEELSTTINKNKSKERFIAFISNLVAGLVIFILGIFSSNYVKDIIGFSDISPNNSTENINNYHNLADTTKTEESIINKDKK